MLESSNPFQMITQTEVVRTGMSYKTFSEHRNALVLIWLWPIIGVNEPDEMV